MDRNQTLRHLLLDAAVSPAIGWPALAFRPDAAGAPEGLFSDIEMMQRLGKGGATQGALSGVPIAAMEFVVLKRCFALAFILLAPAGCVTQDTVPRARADGPAYTQPGIGAPARQTDSFGNSFR